MKKVKLSLLTMCAAALTATALSGCYKGELYDIDEPENLQDRIKQAAINNANKKQTGDFVSVEEPYQVGITGTFKNAYWSTFSKYYKLGKGDTLTLKFRNYSDCKANYDNWCCFVTSDADLNAPEGYEEYAGQRADRWDNIRQQNASFSGTMTSLSNDEEWAAWLKTMNKADVEISVIRNHAGMVKILSTTITSDGKEWTCDQDGIITTGDYVRVIMVCERSYLQFYYSNKVGEEDPKSTIGEVDTGEDHFPISIAIDNYPTALELGDEDYWKNGEATITFDNGATITAKTKDITFTVPDLTTVGKKTIILSYSKSKKGGYGQAVATSYQIEVTAPIQSIEIEAASTIFYYNPGTTTPPAKSDIDVTNYIKRVLGKTGTADIEIASTDYTAEVTSAPATMSDNIVITVTYKNYSTTLEVALQEMKSEDVSLASTWGTIGNTDKSTGWWSAHTPEDYKLENGKGIIIKFKNYGGTNNWNNWVLILRNTQGESGNTPAGGIEYLVGRADNWCWGTNFADDPADPRPSSADYGITKESNAPGDDDWATWRNAMSAGADCNMEIINKGTTADVICTFTSGGINYYQKYLNIPKEAGDMYIDFTVDGSYLEFK